MIQITQVRKISDMREPLTAPTTFSGSKPEVKPEPEKKLSVMEIKGDASERAARCVAMRGFKEAVAEAERKVERKELRREAIKDTICGGVFVGGVTFALWLGSVL